MIYLEELEGSQLAGLMWLDCLKIGLKPQTEVRQSYNYPQDVFPKEHRLKRICNEEA